MVEQDIDINVKTNGDDEYGNGSAESPFKTLGRAIEELSNEYVNGCKARILIGAGDFDIDSYYFLKKSEIKVLNKGFVITQGTKVVFDTLQLTKNPNNPFKYTINKTVTPDSYKEMFVEWGGLYYPISKNDDNSLYIPVNIGFNNTEVTIYKNDTRLNLVGGSDIKAILDIDDGNKEFRDIDLIGPTKKFFLQKKSHFGLLFVYHSNINVKRISASGVYFKRTRTSGLNSARAIDAEFCIFENSCYEGEGCTEVLRCDFNNLFHTAVIVRGGVNGLSTTNLVSTVRVHDGTDVMFVDMTTVCLPETGYITWKKFNKIYLEYVYNFFDGSNVSGALNCVADSSLIDGTPANEWIINYNSTPVDVDNQISFFIEGI